MLDTPQDAGQRIGTGGGRNHVLSDPEAILDAWYDDVYGGDARFAEDFGIVESDDLGAEAVDLDADVGEMFDSILVQQAASDRAASHEGPVGALSDDRIPALPMLFPVRWHSLSLENKAKFRTMMEWFRAAGSGERNEAGVEGTDESLVIDVRPHVPEVRTDGSVVVELSVHPLADDGAGGSPAGMPPDAAEPSEQP